MPSETDASSSDDVAVESDSRFPSGPWKGFFLQPVLPGRHWMELHLRFKQGTLRGEGRDWVGPFIIDGRYVTESGKCWWTKRYIGKHDVAYQGFNEGRGIWGTWEIDPVTWHGGFHIWPVGMADPDSDCLTEALEKPELVGVAASSGDDMVASELEDSQ